MDKKELQRIVSEYSGDSDANEDKIGAVNKIQQELETSGFTAVEINAAKPWGAYLRFDNNDAEAFVQMFFPAISYEDAKRGNPEAELSPKILIVEPGKRLSWQKHARRAECWTFLTDGALYRSSTDELGNIIPMKAGDFIQLDAGERHRLVGGDSLTVVAEIWQHTDSENLSDEEDIVRIEDDFSR